MRFTAVITLLSLQAASTRALCMTVEQCPDLKELETTECQSYHMFAARGSTSPYPGHISDLMRLICNGLNDTCGFENIVYPASNAGGQWCQSAHDGAIAGQTQMANYTQRCPESKLILLGFSQGGSVALDVLGGGGRAHVFGCEQPTNPPLDPLTPPGSNVAAAIVFGPTVRSAGQNYTVKGGHKFNGTAPRIQESLEALTSYSSILREYCQPGDPICAKDSGETAVEKHLNYFDKYNQEAAEWVIKTVQPSTADTEGKATEGEGKDSSEPATSGSSSGIASAISSRSAISVAKVLGIGIVLFLFG